MSTETMEMDSPISPEEADDKTKHIATPCRKEMPLQNNEWSLPTKEMEPLRLIFSSRKHSD